MKVTLRLPLGEIANERFLLVAAMLGIDLRAGRTGPITKRDRFNAQGLEGAIEFDMEESQAQILIKGLSPYRFAIKKMK